MDVADLKRKSVRGGMVTFASQGASVIIGLISTVVLARLLSPNDYGVIAMVMAVTSFAGLFRDLGLSSATIQKHNLTNAQQTNLFWMNVALGTALSVCLVAASPLVVRFYHRPEVLWVTVAMSASILIGSLAAQSNALLVRQMRFGRQAVSGISGALVSLAVSVTLAVHGCRYWALVWGQFANGLISTCLLFVLSPFRPGLPRRGTGVREMLKFGAHITAFDFVNYFHRNLDNILIGRYWGAGPLGLYSRAYSLLMFPINNLRGPINAVAFPAMSRLQNQPDAFRAYYRRITALLGIISMPLSALLFVTAQTVIELALGARWKSVTPIFEILALVGFIQPVITLWGVVLLSRGMGKRYFRLGVFNMICSVIGFIVGLPWGPVGVATGYAVATYVTAYPILTLTFRGTPLNFQDFLASVWRPFISSAISVSICLLASLWMNPGTILLPFLFNTAIFLSVYCAVFFCLPGGKNELTHIRTLMFSVIFGRK